MPTSPLDDAIRTLSKEMATDKDASLIGKTEAELEVLAHYASKGRRRAAMGALCGASIMAGLWKLSTNQKKVVGAFAMLSGGLFGASYGIISIRRDLFADLLMLPSEKSPFATRARTILRTKIPDNSFVKDLHDKFQRSPTAIDSWKEESLASVSPSSKSPSNLSSAPPRFNNAMSSSTPPINGLDIRRDKTNLGVEDYEAFGEPNDTGSRSSIFFKTKSQSADKASDSELRDVHDSRDIHRLEPERNRLVLRHDEDDYYFGVSSNTNIPVEPTTWDEIRSRAARQRK